MIKKIIANAISAALAMGTAGASQIANADMPAPNGMEKCYGVAKAHLNDCSTANHTCAGEAMRDGDKTDWVSVPNGVCEKIIKRNI